MATQIKTLLIDDIDGGEAAETVTFGLDGGTYELDLSAENAASLREAISPWVSSARKVTASPSPSSSANGHKRITPAQVVDLTAVRTWATENGYQVKDRGRISKSVMTAYEQAQAAK